VVAKPSPESTLLPVAGAMTMREVSLRDARAHLGELVNRASRGETALITRRGRPVACLAPAPRRAKRLPSLAAFRSRLSLDGVRTTGNTVVQVRTEERY
jgi:prevent-host-death family protein